MKKFIILFLCTILLSSCGLKYLFNKYSRNSKSSTYFEKNYKRIDTIQLNQIRICKKRNDPSRTNIEKTQGNIIFNNNSIENSLKKYLKSNLKNLKYKNNQNVNWSKSCKNLTRKTLQQKDLLPESYSNENYHIEVAFNINYVTKKNLDISGDWGAGAYDDLGNDISKIEYKLIIALFHRNSLIYMDNYAHWTEILSERGEKLDYKVPEKIIDSLVTNSLDEYNKRLK